jgi:hypothetical protein
MSNNFEDITRIKNIVILLEIVLGMGGFMSIE